MGAHITVPSSHHHLYSASKWSFLNKREGGAKETPVGSYSVPWNDKFQIFGSSLFKSSSLNIPLPSSCTAQGNTKFLKWISIKEHIILWISIKEHIIFQVKERDSQNYLKGFTSLKRKLIFYILKNIDILCTLFRDVFCVLVPQTC